MAQWVLVNEGEATRLPPDNLQLRLFTNNFTPVKTSVAADFTFASGNGADAKTLTQVSWVASVQSGIVRFDYATQEWTFTGSATYYGAAYVLANGKVWMAAKFDTPWGVIADEVRGIIPTVNAYDVADIGVANVVAILSGTPATITNSQSTDVTVSGTDVVAYKYRIDAGAWGSETAVSIHIQLSSLSAGMHILEVIGKDSGGNWQQETSATSYTWSIDLTLPVTTASPVAGTYGGTQSVTISADETVVDIYYTTDGTTPVYPVAGTTQVYSGAISVTETATIKHFARDLAGNAGNVVSDAYTITAENQVPSVPNYALFTATNYLAGGTGFRLNWEASTDPEGNTPITYLVYKDGARYPDGTTEFSTLYADVTSQTAGSNANWTVAAKDSLGGTSSQSSNFLVQLIPPAPTAFSITAGSGTIIPTWTNANGASAYDLYTSVDPSDDTAAEIMANGTLHSGVTKDAAISGFTGGTQVNSCLVARNSSGSSVATAVSSATPDTAAPTLQSATVNTAGTQVTLVFDEVVKFGAGGNGGWTLNSPTNALTYVSGANSNTLVYSTAATVMDADVPTISYTQPTDGTEDVVGNDLATISGAVVVNNSTQTGGSETIYANTTDGYIEATHASSFATIRSATTGGAEFATGGTINIAASLEEEEEEPYDTYYLTDRTFIDFTIPAGANITTATLSLYAVQSAGSPVAGIQTSTHALPPTTADFDSFPSAPNGTSIGQTATITTLNQYYDISTTALRDAVNALRGSGGTLKICVREYAHDFQNSTPAQIYWASFDGGEGTNKPKLVLE